MRASERGKKAGAERDQAECDGHAEESERVGAGDAKQDAAHESGEEEAGDDSEGNTRNR